MKLFGKQDQQHQFTPPTLSTQRETTMTKKATSPSAANIMIKGYLPVRLLLPSPGNIKAVNNDHDDDDGDSHQQQEETFFYVREHKGNTTNNSKKEPSSSTTSDTSKNEKKGCTLFVANVPVVPGISTHLLLKSIFGRYAETKRVTVIKNPRNTLTQQEKIQQEMSWMMSSSSNSSSINQASLGTLFLPQSINYDSEGKYAHIVYGSPKDLKKSMKFLQDVMVSGKSDNDCNVPGLVIDPIEIQTLTDESSRMYKESMKRKTAEDSEDDHSEDDDEITSPSSTSNRRKGIYAIAERYHRNMNQLSRSQLLEECNHVIEGYENAEAAKKMAIENAKSEPDDDGFITVTHSTTVGTKHELDETNDVNAHSRRKGHKRHRSNKKSKNSGAEELNDFYKFQRRDNKKRTLEDLRKQFEEDLRRVKRMKEERQYRPF